MMTSYLIDAVRTPRGRGKAGKGALSGIHPQELFAQLLIALAAEVACAARGASGGLAVVAAGSIGARPELGSDIAGSMRKRR